ncbi:hypothetical protein HH308_01975 [Gordonia sp. TBRC 11910]|uniref:Uncharacterized protein n=1 Tax=Gordonia asplenii TaxID=2725283 RepID=A0A848KUX1_9ACTN|nr:hypothetical protein [Gordonia asplenii]NMN99980.1 hypothetical protein [Gordonia asplenii]
MGMFEDAQRQRESELAHDRAEARALAMGADSQRDAVREFVDAMNKLGCAAYAVRLANSGKRGAYITGWRIDNSSRDIMDRSDQAIVAGDIEASLIIDQNAESNAARRDFIVTPDYRVFAASGDVNGKSVRPVELEFPVGLRMGLWRANRSSDLTDKYGQTLATILSAYVQQVMRSGYLYGKAPLETEKEKRSRLIRNFKDRLSVVIPGMLLTLGILWIASVIGHPTKSAHEDVQTYIPDFSNLYLATILSSVVALALTSLIEVIHEGKSFWFYVGFLMGVLIFFIHLPWSKLDQFGGLMFSVASWWIAPMLAVAGYGLSAILAVMRPPLDARRT